MREIEILLQNECQNYAKLGDSIINFICSASLSNKLKKPIGFKVSNRVLNIALNSSLLNKIAKHLPLKCKKSDIIEALFGILWVKKELNIDKCVDYLTKSLPSNFLYNNTLSADLELAKAIASLVNFLLKDILRRNNKSKLS